MCVLACSYYLSNLVTTLAMISVLCISVVSKNLKEKRFKQLPFPVARLFSISDFRATSTM